MPKPAATAKKKNIQRRKQGAAGVINRALLITELIRAGILQGA